jgi:hypothetical protein
VDVYPKYIAGSSSLRSGFVQVLNPKGAARIGKLVTETSVGDKTAEPDSVLLLYKILGTVTIGMFGEKLRAEIKTEKGNHWVFKKDDFQHGAITIPSDWSKLLKDLNVSQEHAVDGFSCQLKGAEFLLLKHKAGSKFKNYDGFRSWKTS